MKVLYGYGEVFLDVTQSLFEKSVYYIPIGDGKRASLFGVDPLPGVVKVVRIYWTESFVQDYPEHIEITLKHNKIIKGETFDDILQSIHTTLNFVYGSLKDEYPEQLMSLQFIGPRRSTTSGILEIGGNFGRNSCLISALIGKENEHKLVVVESNKQISVILDHNRKINNMDYQVETVAISNTPLIQQGWNTKPMENGGVEKGWTQVNTKCWQEFNDKYKNQGIIFDTLVADCEGALYYILKDEPNFLDNITLVLIENDFSDPSHKEFVDSEFIRNGLKCIYAQKGGWGPCESRFYETWAKT